MAFEGWLIKFGSTALPNSYLEAYEDTPNQRLEIDSYRDTAALLHRETSPNFKTKIVLPIRKLYLGEKILLKAIVDSGIVDRGGENSGKRERKVSIVYWNDEEMDYKPGIFYMTDIKYRILRVDEIRLNLLHAPFEIQMIEY